MIPILQTYTDTIHTVFIHTEPDTREETSKSYFKLLTSYFNVYLGETTQTNTP